MYSPTYNSVKSTCLRARLSQGVKEILNPDAYSPISVGGSHAEGLFQILVPGTWRTTSQADKSPYDALANTLAAHEIFRSLCGMGIVGESGHVNHSATYGDESVKESATSTSPQQDEIPFQRVSQLDFVHFSAKRLKGQDRGDVQEHGPCPGSPEQRCLDFSDIGCSP